MAKRSGRTRALVIVLLIFAVVGSPATRSEASTVYTGRGTGLAASIPRLTTPWTDAARNAAVPLPEYPRPQLTRANWLNLNGRWSYNGGSPAPDAANPPSSAPSFPSTAEQVLVPYPVESYLSGIQRQNDRNLWYRRTFTVPAGWGGQRVKLNFGAVDRHATVYVNGRQVGQHEGGYTAFGFDITTYLSAGSNDLVVGVFDPTDGDGMQGKQQLNPEGLFYTPTSGIWQTVWLEPTPAVNITHLDLTPEVSRGVLRVRVQGEQLAGLTVEATATSGGQPVGSVRGDAAAELSVPVPNAHLWSPGDPYLYDLRVRLTSGATIVDEVGSYFGMRSLNIATVGGVPRPLLNGAFLFQFGALDQGFWPDGIYTAPTDDAIRSDLQTVKDLEFNMVRKHIKVEPQRWYYWADRLGLLVWQDMPNLNPGRDPDSSARTGFETQAHDIVDQHRSSPAIVQWEIFNEGWGDFDMARMAGLFKNWDPSRWIDTHSGINWPPHDSGAGDIVDTHDYDHDYGGPAAPPYGPNRPAVTGEYGGFALRSDGHVWTPGVNCCPFSEPGKLTSAYVEQTNYLRENIGGRGLSAAVYTQLTDVEDELNGILTYDRRVNKMDASRVRAANQALTAQQPFLRPGSPYSFKTVTPGVGDRYIRHITDLGYTEVVTDASDTTLKQDATWRVVSGLADPACFSFAAISQDGKYLRHTGGRLRIDTADDRELFRQDATFCVRTALDASGRLSLESKNYPGYYIRHRSSELWLDKFDNTDLMRADTSWQLLPGGWWHSSVLLNANQYSSVRVLTPGFDNRYLRHLNALAYTEIVTAGSDTTLKQDATWQLKPGLADPTCYSFESRNFPGEYLRHSGSRVSRAPQQDSDLYRHDATFCTRSSSAGTGVRFAAFNLPARYLRHYNTEIWIADGLGSESWNTSYSYDNDTRWSVETPWAP